ncbi:MAG: YdcF family protein [Alphaproteobacteria bacterium]|nr:YdcF family protein [Alphaproteobacteria bacterium]
MYDLVRTLIMPPALPMLVIVAGLLWSIRRPGAGRKLSWAGVCLMYLLSTGLVSSLLMRLVEVPLLDGPIDPAGSGAIVVLSAGAEPGAVEYGGESVDAASLVRVRYAAKLHRDTGLPLLVTGGRTPWTIGAIATAMKKTLEADFAVPVRWIEDRSETTAENASFSVSMLKAEGISKIILVTEAYHMARSVGVFEAQGLAVVPAPTMSRAAILWRPSIIYPNAAALRDSYVALHEMVGAVWYWLRGYS